MELIQTKIYYYPKTECCYTVINVEKNEDGVYTSAKLLKQDSDHQLELTKQTELSTLRNFVNINIKMFSSDGPGEVISAQVKLQNKLETELADPILGATGKSIALFKLFKDSKLIDKDMFLSSHSNVKDNMVIMGIMGFSNPYTFKRFKRLNEGPYWGYYES